MPLQSRLFRGDSTLEACLLRDPAHVLLGAMGDHVGKIHKALVILDNAQIKVASTASADVRAFLPTAPRFSAKLHIIWQPTAAPVKEREVQLRA